MNYLNMCIVEGNLTSDATTKSVGENMLTQFSIAQNRNYINSKNELARETTFFNCEVWGEGFASKTAKFLTKGTPVRVQGRIKIDTWSDENGNKKGKMVLICEKFDFLPIKNDNTKKPEREEVEILAN